MKEERAMAVAVSFWKIVIPTILGAAVISNATTNLEYAVAGFLFLDAYWEILQ